MIMKKDLTKTVVALDPEKVPDEHRERLNQPAILESVDAKHNLALISFADDTQCEVGLDRLIVLKPYNEIILNLIR